MTTIPLTRTQLAALTALHREGSGELGARENIAGYRIRLDVVGPIGNDRVEHVESTS